MLTVAELLKLQERLNSEFIALRDSGGDVATVYRKLILVERKLSSMNVIW